VEKQNQSVSAFEQNGRRIHRFRKPERSDDDKALRKWFEQQGRDNVPGSGPVPMIGFVLRNYSI